MSNKDYIIPFLAIVIAIGLFTHGPIPQDQNYHNFADQRNILGITNFLNAITNLPFALVGLFGLRTVRKMGEKKLRVIFSTLFTGFLLLTFGSGYYHVEPDNYTLIYDRIPITIVFMSFFAFIIHDRIQPSKGYIAFILLNLVGVFSVIYWVLTERVGNGDLRLYAIVQFFPIIAIPLILLLYKSFFNHVKEIVPIFLFFGIAKISESFDKEIYGLLDITISGHSIKHLFMAAAGYGIVIMVNRRAKVVQADQY
ncbi:MAG: ceramidase domain-containing protein [Chitinophagaceae bacterium]